MIGRSDLRWVPRLPRLGEAVAHGWPPTIVRAVLLSAARKLLGDRNS